MTQRKRADKGRAVARYIAAEAEIPAKYEGVGNWIELPYPYQGKIVTDRSLNRIFQYLPEVKNLGFVVRYDGNQPTVGDATVTMGISVFTELLKSHYRANKREGE